MKTFALLALIALRGAASCTDDISCNLNGICEGGECNCANPWYGPNCENLAFAMTPASGKSLFDSGASHNNTWGGPIMTAPDGTYHLFSPLYRNGSLSGPTTMKHGVATVVTGPYDWTTYADLPLTGENPAAVAYVDPATGKKVYTLWVGGGVLVADSPASPFVAVAGFSYPGGNPAPIYYKGAWYLTNQKTLQIFTTPRLVAGAQWTVFSNISHAELPTDQYFVEDPVSHCSPRAPRTQPRSNLNPFINAPQFMFIDQSGNWHIINHAYSNLEYEHCRQSAASAHFFSRDGLAWNYSAQPYNHTVVYDDGTEHVYTTLERPNLFFDATGALTHIVLAADLVTGDEGCGSRTDHVRNGHTPCDDCKWSDLAGTTIITFAG